MLRRCEWAERDDIQLVAYHDEEWAIASFWPRRLRRK